MPKVSQRERILALLQTHEGEWIAAFRLAVISLRYGSRIYELRKLGHQIEIEQKIVNGQWHSSYRLVRECPEATTLTMGAGDGFAGNQSHQEPLDALLESWDERLKSPQHKETTCET